VKEINRLWARVAPRVERVSEEATKKAERLLNGGPQPPVQIRRAASSRRFGAAALAVLLLASLDGC
jgi:hypothetical protein